MGVWGWTKRQARRAKNGLKEYSGDIARGAVTATAAVAGTAVCAPLLGPGAPICGAAAAGLADATVGDVVDRNARRLVQRGADEVADAFDDEKAPPGGVTRLTGGAMDTTELVGGETRQTQLTGRTKGGRGKGALLAAGAGAAAVGLGVAYIIKRRG